VGRPIITNFTAVYNYSDDLHHKLLIVQSYPEQSHDDSCVVLKEKKLWYQYKNQTTSAFALFVVNSVQSHLRKIEARKSKWRTGNRKHLNLTLQMEYM